MVRKKYLNPRPSIPTAIQREVKIESDFACLACKTPVSLTFHHIDGNRENNDTNNVTYLCANCARRADNGEITAEDLRECKKRKRAERESLFELAQAFEYLQKSPKISISKNFGELKKKYQDLLDSYGDKLIFYQCFIYLIPEFYLDNRGYKTREMVREFLEIDIEKEQMIITQLKKMGLIEVVGSLVSLRDNTDAKIALRELIKINKLDINKLLEKFSEI